MGAEYYAGLLNGGNNFDPTLLEEIPDAPTFWEMDVLLTMQEVQSAITGLKNNKAVEPYSLPTEVLKYGGGKNNQIIFIANSGYTQCKLSYSLYW